MASSRGDAGGNPLVAHLMLQTQRRDRQHGDAVFIDQERILVGAVRRAAVLDDAQPPGRDLVDHAVVEQDHAVGDILFQAVSGELALAALAGDDGGDALVLEPAEQPPQLGPQDGRVGQAAEECLDGVQHDALGLDRVDGVAQADEQSFEVVVAGFFDLVAFDPHEVDDQLFSARSVRPGRSRASGRSASVFGGFLEGHEHARLVELHGAADQKLHREQRLAAAGTAADQRRPPARQAAAGDLVKSLNACGSLGQTAIGGLPCVAKFCHRPFLCFTKSRKAG